MFWGCEQQGKRNGPAKSHAAIPVSAIFVLSCGQYNSSSPPFIVETTPLSNDPSAIEPGLHTQTIEHNGTQRSYISMCRFDSTDSLLGLRLMVPGAMQNTTARANLRPLADRDGSPDLPERSILDGDQLECPLPSATNKSTADFGFIDASSTKPRV